MSGWDQEYDLSEPIEAESTRDWLSVLLQFVIVLLLALLSLLASIAVSRMDDPRQIQIIPTNPQPQPQLEASA
jgi:hypothetical protein